MKKEYIIASAGLVGLAYLYYKRRDIETAVAVTIGTMTRKQFIDKYGEQARAANIGTGLLPSVALAQAILESNNGNSSLTRDAFNFFGIKADKSWTGPYVTKMTTEYVNNAPVKVEAKFRKYATPYESFQDRVLFLKKFARYKPVFMATTAAGQANALQNAGYATDPLYASKLIDLISKNNLTQFDV